MGSSRRFGAVLVLGLLTACGSTAERETSPASTSTAAPTTTTVTRPKASARPRAPKPVLAPIVGGVTALGDSVMIDAAPALRAAIPNIDVDAAVSRSALPIPSNLRARAAEGRLAPSLVLDLALNGGVSPGLVDEVLAIAGGRRVVMLTARCPYCTYTATENAAIRSQCTPVRKCHVADWEVLANAHPDWFGADGVHMGVGGRGANAYAQLVRSKLTDPVRTRAYVSARPNFQ